MGEIGELARGRLQRRIRGDETDRVQAVGTRQIAEAVMRGYELALPRRNRGDDAAQPLIHASQSGNIRLRIGRVGGRSLRIKGTELGRDGFHIGDGVRGIQPQVRIHIAVHVFAEHRLGQHPAGIPGPP